MMDDEQRAPEQGATEIAPDVAGEGAPTTSKVVVPPGPIMIVAAHPDDADIGCGGTMAAMVARGQEVVTVVVTDGTEGGEDPAVPDDELRDLREAEQRAALQELGVTQVEFLRYPDGRLQASLEVRKRLTALIRRYRPLSVFVHDPTAHIFEGYINHPDHRAAGLATLDAIFPAAGNPRSFRELLSEGLTAHKVREVYLFYTAQANAWIDIEGEPLQRKARAVACHRSQISNPEESLKWLSEGAQRSGAEAGIAAAEGFRRIVLGEE